MAVVPIISQSWDTTSYVNPTRMNNIETNIGIVSKATGIEYSSGVSVKDKIDSLNTDLTNYTPISLGTVTGNSTKNVQFPAQSSGIFFFLGAEQELVGEAIAHAWSSDRLMRFIGTQPTKVSIVTGPQAFAVTNSSGNTLLVYYQRIRGDMPWMG